MNETEQEVPQNEEVAVQPPIAAEAPELAPESQRDGAKEVTDFLLNLPDQYGQFKGEILKTSRFVERVVDPVTGSWSKDELAKALFEVGRGYLVTSNVRFFDQPEGGFVDKIVKSGEHGDDVFRSEQLSDPNISPEVKNEILDRWWSGHRYDFVADNLETFESLQIHPTTGGYQAEKSLQQNLVDSLLGRGDADVLLKNREKFTEVELNDEEIARRCLERGEHLRVDNLTYILPRFNHLSGELLAEISEKINKDHHQHNSPASISEWWRSVLENREVFLEPDFTTEDVAVLIIKGGHEDPIHLIRKLELKKTEKLAEALLARGEYSYYPNEGVRYLLENRGLFDVNWTDNDLAQKIVSGARNPLDFQPNYKFEYLFPETFRSIVELGDRFREEASENIYAGYGNPAEQDSKYIVDNLDKFIGLSSAELNLLSEIHPDKVLGIAQENVSKNPHCLTEDAFKGLELLKENYLLLGEYGIGEKETTRDNKEEIRQCQETVFKNLPNRQMVETHLLDQGFTAQQLLRFAYREGLSRHDAFVAAEDIGKMFKISGLSPERFCGQIFDQVAKDEAVYDSGNANYELSRIANRGVKHLEQVRESLASLELDNSNSDAQSESFHQLAEQMLSEFKSDEDIFKSWRSLKAYSEKCRLILEDRERLLTISRLQADGKEKLAQWYGVISASNDVSTEALTEFLTNPGSFFEREASHTPESLHESKKPSNYTEVPNLDLTAEELRDALIEGSMDQLASLPMMEMQYVVRSHNTKEALNILLGSRSSKTEGAANDPKQLFHELRQVLAPYNISIQDYLSGPMQNPEIESAITGLADQVIISGAYNKKLFSPHSKEYIAAVYAKSSPFGVLAGNDTACCMPFGDGKNNVYMFNPACAQFAIQEPMSDGTRRTIIQSVMSLNLKLNTDKTVDQILGQDLEYIGEILPENAYLTSERLLVADNAEVAPNFNEQENAHQLSELLYGDFFARYLAELGQAREVKNDEIQIGENYSKTLTHLPRVPNKSVPVAPVSYSDNIESTSLLLRPQISTSGQIESAVTIAMGDFSERKMNLGVSALTFEDTLPTAYLEGKVYGGTDLFTGLHNMENGLIAKDINNNAKGRPELSFKYLGSDNKLEAYIFAYQGIWGAEKDASDRDEWNNEDYMRDEEAEQEVKVGEPCIYISDYASRGEKPVAAGKILNQFVSSYKENYLDRGNALPIYCQAREGTSYEIITKQLPRFAERLGVKLTLEEVSQEETDAGIMHTVVIRPTA